MNEYLTPGYDGTAYAYNLSSYVNTPHSFSQELHYHNFDASGVVNLSFKYKVISTHGPITSTISFGYENDHDGNGRYVDNTNCINDGEWHTVTSTRPANANGKILFFLLGNPGYSGGDYEEVAIDNIIINGIPITPPVANVTIRTHEYTGEYVTSPLINSTAYLNGQVYEIAIIGSTYTIDKGEYNITIIKTGYDTVTVTRDIQADEEIDLYLLKQNNVVVNYDVVDSITAALVTSPDVQFYDTVTGNRTNITNNKGLITVLRDHQYIVNASKAGYTSTSQSYIFTGDTQISIVLGSQQVAPEGKAYVTVKAWHNAHGEPGVNIHMDGKVQATDESGLTTFLVNDSGSYGWTADKVGFYPTNGGQAVNGYTRFDIILTPRAQATATPGLSEVNTTIIDGYKNLVDGAIGGVTGIITGGIDLIVAPVNILNDSVTTVRTTVEDGMGFAGNSTNVFTDLFGVIVFGLPWQVKGLITYYLAWLLALMFLNR